MTKRFAFFIILLIVPVVLLAWWYFPGFPPKKCASNVCTEALTIQTESWGVDPGDRQEMTIQCENGAKATGGGFVISPDVKMMAWENRPTEDGKGWIFSVTNQDTVSGGARGYVVCVDVN
jgi:hypothetical protein